MAPYAFSWSEVAHAQRASVPFIASTVKEEKEAAVRDEARGCIDTQATVSAGF